MIGAHELLLIVRAQNQASAALGRVSRDLQRLETRRMLATRQQQLAIRQSKNLQQISANGQKIEQLRYKTATESLQVRRTEERIAMRQLSLNNQLANLGLRTANIERQRERLMQREVALGNRIADNQARQEMLMGRTMTLQERGQKIQRASRLAQRQMAADIPLARHRLYTTGLERQLRLEQASARVRRLRAAEEVDPEAVRQAEVRQNIARRRLAEVPMMRSQINVRAAGMRDAIKNNALALEQNSRAIMENEANISGLIRRQDELRATTLGLSKEYDVLVAREGAVSRRAVELDAQLQHLTTTELELSRAVKAEVDSMRAAKVEQEQLIASSRLLAEEQKQLSLAIKTQSWERLQTGARAVSHLGRVMQLFGLVTTAALGYAAKGFADFNTQVTLAATQDITPGKNSVKQIQQVSAALSKGIMDVLASGKAVASAPEFTKAGYDILSGVTGLKGDSIQKANQALALLKQFNQVTKANFGLVGLDQVTQAGITLMNTFGTSIANLPHEFDVMQNAVNRGRLTMGQFTDGLNQTAPAAKAAGYSFDQMAATLSFLSTKFPNYNRAVVGYSRLVEILANKKLINNLKNVGVSITDASGKHLLPFDQVIARLVKRFPELEKGGLVVQNFFKRFSGQTGFIGARRAFTVAVQDQVGLAKFASQIPANARGLVNASATALSQTGAVRWAMLVTQFKALALTLGQDVIPAFQTLGKYIGIAVRWFNSLSEGTKKTIAEFLVWGSIGTLIVGVFATLGGSIVSFIAYLRLMRMLKAAEEARALAGGIALIGSEAGIASVEMAVLLGGFVILAGAAYLLRGHLKGLVDSTHDWVQLMEAFAVGGAVFLMVKYSAALASAVKWMRALVAATRAMIVAEGVLAGASVAAEGAVAGLGVVLGGLFAPEVLIGLAATAAALALIKAASSPPGLVKGSEQGLGFVRRTPSGQYQRVIRGMRGGERVIDITKQEAIAETPRLKALQDAAKIRHRAVVQEVADSPRYTHAIGANQKALNKEYDASVRAAAERARLAKINRAAGIAPTTDMNKLADRWINRIEAAHKLALGSPSDLAKAKNYHRLLRLMNQAFKDQPDMLAAINDMLQVYDGNLKDAAKSAEDVKITTEDMLSGLQGMFDNFKQQNQSAFGDIFQGPWITGPIVQNRLDWSGMLNMADLQKDLTQQVGSFAKWRKDINRLIQRGAPQSLVDAIMAAGPTATKQQVELLNKATPEQLKKYKSTWLRGQQEIKEATMRDLNRQIAIYKTHGQKIAEAIIAGIRSQDVGVTNVLEAMIKKMFPGLEKAGKTAPTPPGGNGKGKGDGGGGGKDKSDKKDNRPNVTVNVKADGASTPAQIKHAAWVAANRHHHR